MPLVAPPCTPYSEFIKRGGGRHTTSERPLTSSTREARRPPPELQATPNYRPCTCHCLEKRRRRFEAPSTRIYPNMPHSRKRCKPPLAAVCIVLAEIQATYIGATCPKPPTCRTPNLCPSSTFINWATRFIDQYAKVKLGGGNEFMAKGPLIFMSEVVKW